MDIQKEAQKVRKPNYKITPLIANRWSPRAMSGERLSDDEIMPLFEAARWAPSSFNHQPWRFIYAKRDTEHWNTLFDLLGDWNKAWCANASVLCVIASQENFEYNNQPNATHHFSTGSAFENLALEGVSRNLVVHGMAGFDYEKARSALKIPKGYTVEAMCAIGRPGKREELPEKFKDSESPSDRKPLKEIISEGTFTFK